MTQNEKLADLDYIYTSKSGKKTNIELRCRNHAWGKYPTVWIKAAKLSVALTQYRDTKIKFRFIVRTLHDNVIKSVTIDDRNIHLLPNSWGGRNIMRDHRDREWVVDVPIKLFNKI